MENKIIEKDENKNEEIEKIEGKEAEETKKVFRASCYTRIILKPNKIKHLSKN